MCICMLLILGLIPLLIWMNCKGKQTVITFIFLDISFFLSTTQKNIFQSKKVKKKIIHRIFVFSTMTSISIQNLTTSAHILGLADLSGYSNINPNTKISHTTYNGSIRTPELATIILAFVVFAGSLATAFCVVCVRYKR